VKEEVGYKRAAVAKAAQVLNEVGLRELMRDGRFDEFIARLENTGRAPHLLYVAAPRKGDLSILYEEALDKPSFCAAVLNLLYRPGPSHERLDAYSRYVVSKALFNKWTFPTYFLFLCHPATEVLVAPSRMQWFLWV
jgi:hypothetical protein